MALVDVGLGAAILANLCTNGVAGRTSARVSTIIWDWKMKMWGNLGTGPGACALCWGLAKAVPGRVGGCLWFCVGEVSACCHYKTRALCHICANGAQVSEAQALQLLNCIILISIFSFTKQRASSSLWQEGVTHGGPHASQSPSAGGDLLPLLALPLEEGRGEQLPRSALALPWHCSCSPLLKPAAKPGSRTVDVHSALCFQNPVHGGVGSWRHPSPN